MKSKFWNLRHVAEIGLGNFKIQTKFQNTDQNTDHFSLFSQKSQYYRPKVFYTTDRVYQHWFCLTFDQVSKYFKQLSRYWAKIWWDVQEREIIVDSEYQIRFFDSIYGSRDIARSLDNTFGNFGLNLNLVDEYLKNGSFFWHAVFAGSSEMFPS